MSSYFFLQATKNEINAPFLSELEKFADETKELIYVVDRPLGDQKYSYDYSEALVVLSPKRKISVIDFGKKQKDFDAFVDDLIEDIGSISDKYLYKDVIGRPRKWRETLFETKVKIAAIDSIEHLFETLKLSDESEKKRVELLISLFIGSINNMERVKENVPVAILDKVKQKIQLFDGDQTRFVYQKPEKKKITIQGLSGTGKTELLLHKLKELYVSEASSKICFTCHNKILADSLRNRIPEFFNFLKVEQQIEWEKRLWCTNAWGASSMPNSGAYRYICAFYQVPFYSYSYQMSFGKACGLAVQDIKEKYKGADIPSAFDFMLIDESQDFDENFIALCELITSKNVYVAGDIFQSIFDAKISGTISPDFLLGKCYRTDPKTLMFAHALGMGLFEKQKLRWLEQKEWQDCGYKVEIDEMSNFHLSREPLRRFEDVDENFQSIEIAGVKGSISDRVIGLINDIIQEHPTAVPDDIGIIFLDQSTEIYKWADALEFKIRRDFKWAVNKAYESKAKISKSILISNRNNVKGLEFPFVICITGEIKDGLSYRNSLYTMLTRSFIKSYLVLPVKDAGLTKEMIAGLEEIVLKREMVIKEPTHEEKKKIRTKFEYKLKSISHYDLMIAIFEEEGIDRKYFERLLKASQDMGLVGSERETLHEFVRSNYKYVKGGQ